MAPSSLRFGQAGLCFIVTILAILVCCSTPTARNLNFLTNVSSTRKAVDPNSNFQGLVLGVRGFCNKNKCASYSSYAANPSKVASNLKLTKPQKKAVVLLAGKGANPSGRAWYQLNILSIIATIASTFAFVLAALLATFAKQGERNQTPIQLTALRMAFLGFLAIAFIMNISTWGYAFSTFNKPKSALEKVKDRGSWGPAFWISLFTWILLLGAAGLEPSANKGQGQDGDQERTGGGYGGGGGGYGNDY